jgi:flagellar hook-basal body complex protein FliE
MALGAIGAVGAALPTLPSVPTSGTTAAAPTAGTPDFGGQVQGALENLSAMHNDVDRLAEQAAVGSLQDVHDYTIAAAEASVMTELTVAVRNKAVEAFNDIMRMQL